MLALKLSFLLLVLASENVAIVAGSPLPWFLPGPCDSDPCKNSGKCTVVPFSYTCACADGWKGSICTVKVKPCESSPCKNGATCTDKDDTFECACEDGYLGETCSPERIQCENPLDLLFVVDASSWQITGDFTHVTDYMSDLIDWLKISDLAVKAGVIAFSYKADTRVIFLPDAYSDASQLKNAIGNLKKNGPKIFYGHEGYTAKALKLANDEVFKTADQHPNAAKAIVLLTPQVPLDSKSDAIEEAKELRAKGVKIVSIDLVNVFKAFFKDQSVCNELTKISSPLKPIASAYDKLDEHVREVTNLLCSFTKDPCEDMDCGKRKICSYDRDTASCICNKTNCEAQPCDETPCKNDGECENVDKETFKCNCTEAWTGETCQEKGKVTWSVKSPCNPVICGNKIPTTPQPPSPTPAPPVQPLSPTLSPLTQPPSPTPAPPVQLPSPAPAPPVQLPSPTPAPPVQLPSPTPALPVQLPSSTPAPPVQLPPTPVAPPTQPGELSCPTVVEKKGCFKEDQKPPRLLPNYILTDRDSSLKIYSGQGVDWRNWVNYLPDLVCRCAQLAKSKKFKFFGIQYYGECWSGPAQDESSFKEDGSSTECVNTDWKECSDQSKFACAGKQFNNYVYAIVS